jgi:cobyrinic acid a,c-diamide synthase
MRGVIIAGTHSGCGKTTITLGIMAALRKKGLKVQPFKTGPDYIDTGLHRLITGRDSRNLDLWMCGRDYVRECFYTHSIDADIAIVEGVMGMYDGELNTADLAATLGLPVVLVVDAYGMAESAGAMVKGFASFNTKAQIIGVIFNRVASDRHFDRLKASTQNVPVLGYLPADLDFKIPHRHLGLFVAEEEPITKKEIDKLAKTALKYIDIDYLVQKSKGFKDSKKYNFTSETHNSKSKIKIAIAYDKAFCFYYRDNLDLLRKQGAELVFFSPLSDSRIPDDVDALYIGGGYPELYAEKLSNNRSMIESVKNCIENGMPVYAECGGFMYLTEGIYDFKRERVFHPLVGSFPFKIKMTRKRLKLGYRETVLKKDSIFGTKGAVFRGHEFHYSEIVNRSQNTGNRTQTIYIVKDSSSNKISDEGYMIKNTLGSYIHIHFGSNPAIAKNFVNFAISVKKYKTTEGIESLSVFSKKFSFYY